MRKVLLKYEVFVRLPIPDPDSATRAAEMANQDARKLTGYVGHTQPLIVEVTS